eukprot:TRINITY_DN28981_c0_g2_i1.p1 TRINITY_DN28981_c0_g2~~TRINITY_DN28981_c0_g2_i1.p1  ORF type:complete len:485 (+),score=79.93 TRINITY_DN28981_c0_g2_i1:75-1529(+)
MSQRRPAFIVSHGSFNPVHRHHLEMMVRARQCLESAGYEVVRGVMAITPTTRLARKGAEAVIDYHRLEALRIGCDSMLETRGWLAPEPRGVDFGSGGQLVNGLSSEFYAQEPQATIFKVIGADVAVRYRGELKGPTVVVCREGSTKAVQAAIHGAERGRKDLFLVDQLSGEECSSTKIRDALRLQDESVVRRLCPEAVAKYLLEKREGLYGAVPSNWSPAGYLSAAAVAAASKHLPDVKPLESPVATAPAPGPGHGITPADLRAQWSQTYPSSEVLGFYGHGVKAGDFKCFSNFYDQSQTPFDFVVPPAFCSFALLDVERVVRCDFSEKAIMLCKAAAMGDRDSFEAMKVSQTPAHVKSLGRSVKHFDDAVWNQIVCAVAFEVVYQKFSKTNGLAELLLGTGCQLIAEATRNDRNWGIGIDVGDPLVQQPSKWRGSNILGWALMEARAALRTRGSVHEAPGVEGEQRHVQPAKTNSSGKRWKKA